MGLLFGVADDLAVADAEGYAHLGVDGGALGGAYDAAEAVEGEVYLAVQREGHEGVGGADGEAFLPAVVFEVEAETPAAFVRAVGVGVFAFVIEEGLEAVAYEGGEGIFCAVEDVVAVVDMEVDGAEVVGLV